MSEYKEYRKRKCAWCAKGGTPLPGKQVHKVYPMSASGGFKDLSIKTPLSQYLPCTAPTEEEYVTELESNVAELLSAIKALFAMVRGECPSLLEDDHHYELVVNAITKAEKAVGQ